MKKYIIVTVSAAFLLMACAGSKKRGCPSTSSTMGAERVLAGEKPEKKSKFKIREMK